MGPTVCELEGPIPILNMSKTLIGMVLMLEAIARKDRSVVAFRVSMFDVSRSYASNRKFPPKNAGVV